MKRDMRLVVQDHDILRRVGENLKMELGYYSKNAKGYYVCLTGYGSLAIRWTLRQAGNAQFAPIGYLKKQKDGSLRLIHRAGFTMLYDFIDEFVDAMAQLGITITYEDDPNV
jgi:hypothetical protein